jgi:hypothetical protein
MYDVRAVCRYLAVQRGRVDHIGGTRPAFSAAFSRALRGLVAPGPPCAVFVDMSFTARRLRSGTTAGTCEGR